MFPRLSLFPSGINHTMDFGTALMIPYNVAHPPPPQGEDEQNKVLHGKAIAGLLCCNEWNWTGQHHTRQ